MKKFNFASVGAALALTLGVALPASAQMTYNFSTTGNCNFPPATCTVTGSPTVAANLTMSGWSAAAGANFAAATITDQDGSGVGMRTAGEATGSPENSIDSSGNHDLIALNFGTNRVVLTTLQTGWSNTDTDIAVLRWNGSGGPDLLNTKLTDGTTGLVARGWQIVSTEDMDGIATAHGDRGVDSHTTGAAVTAANASSWWIVTAHFGGGSLGTRDSLNDYFKLLSVSARCVGSTSGGACNTTTRVPEPGSLALAGIALVGAYGVRRRKTVVQK